MTGVTIIGFYGAMPEKKPPLVNEFYDRALSEQFRVAAAALRKVDLVVFTHSPANPNVILHETFASACDRVESATPILDRLSFFMACHDKKVMTPREIDFAQEKLDEILNDIDQWIEKSGAVLDFTIRLSAMKPAERAGALESIPLEALKNFMRSWESDRQRPLINEIQARLSKPNDIFESAALIDVMTGKWQENDKALSALPYVPRI